VSVFRVHAKELGAYERVEGTEHGAEPDGWKWEPGILPALTGWQGAEAGESSPRWQSAGRFSGAA
jgi:hypothetical protein